MKMSGFLRIAEKMPKKDTVKALVFVSDFIVFSICMIIADLVPNIDISVRSNVISVLSSMLAGLLFALAMLAVRADKSG